MSAKQRITKLIVNGFAAKSLAIIILITQNVRWLCRVSVLKVIWAHNVLIECFQQAVLIVRSKSELKRFSWKDLFLLVFNTFIKIKTQSGTIEWRRHSNVSANWNSQIFLRSNGAPNEAIIAAISTCMVVTLNKLQLRLMFVLFMRQRKMGITFLATWSLLSNETCLLYAGAR